METALKLIEERLGKIEKITKILENYAVEFVSSKIFCNIALFLDTSVSPISMLLKIKEIEREMGREYDTSHFGEYKDRIIDIDIVSYGKLLYESKILTLPHKKHLEREFSKKLLYELYS